MVMLNVVAAVSPPVSAISTQYVPALSVTLI
jgi:hypothetical protein